MIIVDTSVWIEFFRARAPYIATLTLLLEEKKIFAMECIFGELLQGALSSREIKILKNYWSLLPKAKEAEIWVEAGILSSQGKWFSKGVGLIDLAIVVAARTNKLQIWTLDKKLASVLSTEEKFYLPRP